MEKGASGEDNT